MPETNRSATAAIPEDVLRARLAQSEQMREFFLQMWLENPALAKGAGERVQTLLRPLATVPPAPTSVDNTP